MHKRGLAHHARRRSDTSRETNCDLVQLLIGQLDLFCNWTAALQRLWLERPKLFEDRGDCVLAPGLDDLAALELVRIDVADQCPQSFQVLTPRARLIVLFDEWYGQLFLQLIKREL